MLGFQRLPGDAFQHPLPAGARGAAGKDTRGFIRLHQFSKVELVKITTAETSMEEFEKLTADAEDILKRLGLHYHTLLMCSGDMGFAQYKKYDLEAWCPGLDRFLEVSSCSVFNDFRRCEPTSGTGRREGRLRVLLTRSTGAVSRLPGPSTPSWRRTNGPTER